VDKGFALMVPCLAAGGDIPTRVNVIADPQEQRAVRAGGFGVTSVSLRDRQREKRSFVICLVCVGEQEQFEVSSVLSWWTILDSNLPFAIGTHSVRFEPLVAA
jgi:hypothetical protein